MAVIQAREKQLQQQLTSLRQLISDLRCDLDDAKKHNEDLQKRLGDMVMSTVTTNMTAVFDVTSVLVSSFM